MTSAKWNSETKARLSEKVVNNMNDISTLTKHIIRSSKSNEMLEKSAKNFASHENLIDNCSSNLKKMALIVSQLQFQADSIERNVLLMDDLQDQLKSIQK